MPFGSSFLLSSGKKADGKQGEEERDRDRREDRDRSHKDRRDRSPRRRFVTSSIHPIQS